jgi:hypothetical protein
MMTRSRRTATFLPLVLTLCYTSFVSAFVAQRVSSDWFEAELTLRNFPKTPNPDLPAEHVARCCLRSLQFVDHPYPSSGLSRLYPFLTWECIRSITARSKVLDAKTFCEYGALSPVLQPLMGATRIELDAKDCTISPGTKTRGEIVSFHITVYGAEVLAFQHKSGLIRDRVSQGPPRVDMVIRLEQVRRPPLAGSWLVKEIVDVRYASGGLGWSRHEGV